jgi:HD-like signal output (HDOD) protein
MEVFCDETGLSAKVRQHSAAVAAIARTLAHGRPLAAEVFLCGLMHDIGKLMILQTVARRCATLAEDPSAMRVGIEARQLEAEWMELVRARREMLGMR